MVLGALLLSVGCGEPKLDTSSDQAFSASLEKIYNSVPKEERETFRDYLHLAMEGKVSALARFFSEQRRVPSYDEIVKSYSLVKAFGDMELINRLHGLTKTDIINTGKAILKKDLEIRQSSIQKELVVLQKQIADCQAFADDMAKVVIELSDQVTAVESNRPGDAGKVGAFEIAAVIKNGSSRHLRGISGGKMKIIHENNIEMGGLISFFDFETEDGEKLFDKGYQSIGLAPGETAKGKIRQQITPSSRFPYPQTKASKYVIWNNEIAKPWLDGRDDFSQYDEKQAQDRLDRCNKQIEAIKQELARLN